jgi:alpha-L-rhamnosidase
MMQMRLACSLVLAFFTFLPTVFAFGAEEASFVSAKPIWLKNREKEMNLTVGFRAAFDAKPGEKASLRIAAATIYRAWINGEFLGCGPARGPHGFYRVDQYDLSGKLKPGKNLVAIEVAGYNSNSYALLDQPSFLQAETASGSQVLASTSGAGQPFTAQLLNGRVQKVQRYSFQRPFSEVYRLTSDFDRWLRDANAPTAAAETAVQAEKKLLPRGVLYPDYAVDRPKSSPVAGHVESIATPKNLWKDRSLTNIGPKLKGFPEKELATIPSIEAQCFRSIPTSTTEKPYDAATPISLAAKEYKIVDFGADRTGFLGAKVTCKQKTRLWFLFDELLTNNDVDFRRLGCVNIISYELEPGVYRLESIEPNTVRYLKLLCLDGACDIEGVHLQEYAHPSVAAKFASSDPRLDRIFAAGVETFRQNSLDIFMDCPSRERAGWLCDSFFTSRAAADLEGEARVERNFVENFLLPAKFEFLPDGMLPMCYPSDHNDGVYIPNWALWFVVELDEYAARSGDRATVDALRPKVLKLFDFFKKYENKDGLLEKLPSWVFVEWSEAAKFVQDVNYPSNMLYAGALAGAGRMYKMPELTAKADRILDAVRKQSFDGQFFVDNALRKKDGSLQVTRNRTEVCQYYAFFFHAATPESQPALWATLRDKFGPNRKQTKAFPEIFQANSFIGNMLRMELLSDAGLSRQILDESIAYLLYMADRTGTLWENVDTRASCNHAFASHIVHTLYRDVLGVRSIDRVGRKATIQFNDVPLEFCEGDIPTPDGIVHLRWQVKGRRIEYELCLPPGYQATIVNRTSKRLVAR